MNNSEKRFYGELILIFCNVLEVWVSIVRCGSKSTLRFCSLAEDDTVSSPICSDKGPPFMFLPGIWKKTWVLFCYCFALICFPTSTLMVERGKTIMYTGQVYRIVFRLPNYQKDPTLWQFNYLVFMDKLIYKCNHGHLTENFKYPK